MTILGIDDTDSRDGGMCTTYVAHRIAERLREDGHVDRPLLVRLNPAVKHKTRGNAALAVHTDRPTDAVQSIACDLIGPMAETDDPNTNPGVVLAPDPADGDLFSPSLDAVIAFSRAAVRDQLTIVDAERVIEAAGFGSEYWGNGRGRIGALAAVGALTSRMFSTAATQNEDRVFDDWTYECISYRERSRWGTNRAIDIDSVVRAAEEGYPTVWDTVDRERNEAVCVPHTPCPVLYGIRGDDLEECESVARAIESEPVSSREAFVTNQGTDAHLRDGEGIPSVMGGRAYRLTGCVNSPPETRQGGHVFMTIEADGGKLRCAAFEPTKRFRDRVRALQVGDRITVCGEVSDETLKLEKFAVRSLVRTERVTPTCPKCDRRMESAGREQGYRCRECETAAEGKSERELEREIEPGWYEVPPCARRHIAKPLVRGGFDAPAHPER